MKKKKIIVLMLLFALAGGGWYAYREYSRKVPDLRDMKPRIHIEANGLLNAFERNEAESNALYLGNIIAVKGPVKKIEKNDEGNYAVILGEENSMSSVRCSMDTAHQQDIAKLVAGTIVTIKGACTGFTADELLGADVILNRAVLEK